MSGCVRPTFNSPLKEHLAAAAGDDPVVASRGLVRTHQTDLVRLPARLGLTRHCRTDGLSRSGWRAEKCTEKERKREQYVKINELHPVLKTFVTKVGCRALLYRYWQSQWYVVLLLGDVKTLKTNPAGDGKYLNWRQITILIVPLLALLFLQSILQSDEWMLRIKVVYCTKNKTVIYTQRISYREKKQQTETTKVFSVLHHRDVTQHTDFTVADWKVQIQNSDVI